LQANTNEIVAASVVYLGNVDLDRPSNAAAWNASRALRHFSVVRKLNGLPFPAGAPLLASHCRQPLCILPYSRLPAG
jgi:hypothetical protein